MPQNNAQKRSSNIFDKKIVKKLLRPPRQISNLHLCAAVGRSAFRRATCRSFLGRFLPRLGPLSQAAFFFLPKFSPLAQFKASAQRLNISCVLELLEWCGANQLGVMVARRYAKGAARQYQEAPFKIPLDLISVIFRALDCHRGYCHPRRPSRAA